MSGRDKRLPSQTDNSSTSAASRDIGSLPVRQGLACRYAPRCPAADHGTIIECGGVGVAPRGPGHVLPPRPRRLAASHRCKPSPHAPFRAAVGPSVVMPGLDSPGAAPVCVPRPIRIIGSCSVPRRPKRKQRVETKRPDWPISSNKPFDSRSPFWNKTCD